MNLNRIFDGLVSSGVAGGLAGGAASALLVQGLSSKQGRRRVGKAAKLGGAAIIGGLAWKAYEQYRGRRSSQGTASPAETYPAGQDTVSWKDITRDQFLPEAGPTAARRDWLVLRAMITAAHADGHIDTDERIRIYQRIESLELSHEEKGLLMEEISTPLDLEQLVQQVPNRALAAEVYVAALLMADSPAPAHRLFLHDLAERLALPADFVASMHAEVSPSKPVLEDASQHPVAMVSPQA